MLSNYHIYDNSVIDAIEMFDLLLKLIGDLGMLNMCINERMTSIHRWYVSHLPLKSQQLISLMIQRCFSTSFIITFKSPCDVVEKYFRMHLKLIKKLAERIKKI